MSEEEAEAPSSGPGPTAGSIVVVDPDPASRGLAEDLEDELDRQMIALDSMDFDVESSEEVLEASAFVICWDLGIRSGADLLELVRHDPALSDRSVLIAMEAPTRAAVQMAMALGADGVCCKPYDAEEIAGLLARSEAARTAEAA